MLHHYFEKQGQWLFKYRGQLPLLLFLLIIITYFIEVKALLRTHNIGTYGLTLLFIVIGFLIRGWTIGTTPSGTSGRNRQHQEAQELNTNGIYSIVRHPLYLGNFLIWQGLAIYTLSYGFVFVFIILFALFYERIMYAEEQFLWRKYGST